MSTEAEFWKPIANQLIDLGRDSVRFEAESLERRERAVAAGEARLRAMAVVLGVAEWVIERDDSRLETVVTFRILDIDHRGEPNVKDLVNQAIANGVDVTREGEKK